MVTTTSMIAVSRSSRTPQSDASVPETIQRNKGSLRVTPSNEKNTIHESRQARNRSPVAVHIAPFSESQR